jgi:hypothetical protein
MKKIVAVMMIGVLLAVPSSAARAVQDDVITDAQITAIRTHCTDIQGALNRLQQADTLLRHNRGQLYRTIADKLMSPLNQRIASSQLDGAELVTTTAQYNKEYQVFFDAYKNYDIELSQLLTIDCRKQPTSFYDKLDDVREKRIQLHNSSVKIIDLAAQYKKQFDVFRTKQLANLEKKS